MILAADGYPRNPQHVCLALADVKTERRSFLLMVALFTGPPAFYQNGKPFTKMTL